MEVGADPNVAATVRFLDRFRSWRCFNYILSQDGYFALHEAVSHGHVEAVKLLLEGGADRTMLDKVSLTLKSLHLLNVFCRMA